MRIARYLNDGTPSTGVVLSSSDGDRILDVGARPVDEFLVDEKLLAALRVAADAASVHALPMLDPEALLAPVSPSKILCIGYNYRGHVPAGEEARPTPTVPDVFVKTPNTVGGPADAVVLPETATDVDYEGEIAIVIGRGGCDIPLDDAAAHIGGYTLVNDVSERTWQGRSSQWTLGKCADGFAPIGPWVVTADDIADPHDLRVEVVRDGVVTVSQSTADMVFTMAALVHHLSRSMTLLPGDVIATGSPQKRPEALAAHRPLADGDSVTIRGDGLGELTTTFREGRR